MHSLQKLGWVQITGDGYIDHDLGYHPNEEQKNTIGRIVQAFLSLVEPEATEAVKANPENYTSAIYSHSYRIGSFINELREGYALLAGESPAHKLVTPLSRRPGRVIGD